MIAREKMKRPSINTKAAIKEAVEPFAREQTQVSPQPGLENKVDVKGANENLSPKEKMDRLIEFNNGLGIESVLKLEGEAPPQASQDQTKAAASDDTKIQPVETKSGGLLFSSDPDLPRTD